VQNNHGQSTMQQDEGAKRASECPSAKDYAAHLDQCLAALLRSAARESKCWRAATAPAIGGQAPRSIMAARCLPTGPSMLVMDPPLPGIR
jgi:hypothetical protein